MHIWDMANTGARTTISVCGGQPIHDGEDFVDARTEVLYGLDKVSNLRFSHENPAVLECYNSYLEKPLSHVAHELLHTEHEGWNMPL